jgi:hypothetical protein
LARERRCATPTNLMINTTTNKSKVRAEQAASKKYQSLKLGLDVQGPSFSFGRRNASSQPGRRESLKSENGHLAPQPGSNHLRGLAAWNIRNGQGSSKLEAALRSVQMLGRQDF